MLFLSGLIIIIDLFITRFVNWTFWKPQIKKGEKQKAGFEVLDALILAAIAAIFLRLFIIEAYTIPTSSMEKTLLAGDYIFVGKMKYGPRLPITPLSLPFTHNVLPLTNSTPSYLSWIKSPYKRLKGFTSIKHNDIVVFNYPEGDTVVVEYPNQSYYSLVRQYGRNFVRSNYTIKSRPVDKKDNYIKRCIGLPGDEVQIIHGIAHVNDKMEKLPGKSQFNYFIKTEGNEVDTLIFNSYEISLYDIYPNVVYID